MELVRIKRLVSVRRKRTTWLAAVTAGAVILGLSVPSVAVTAATTSGNGGTRHPYLDCSSSGARALCPEVSNSDHYFGHYVGHDEPSVLFDSKTPGSGNRMTYKGILPKEPPATPIPGKRSYDFNLYPAFWFGMILCDTQSYPLTVKKCVPDSNSNISPAGSPYHAGAAYMELQFYPPGYVQQWNGFSCSATQWCTSLNIFSFSSNPFTGQSLNAACQAKAGLEYGNFAYLTHSGVPQGPPNPVQFTPAASGNPNPHKVFYLNQGDHYTVTMHDTRHGLQTVVHDTTTGQSGSMTASAANGFGQVKFAPTGTSCTNIPYDFHPMYSTSTPATTVPWAAATYNVAIDTEIGHFDYCSNVVNAACAGNEGAPPSVEKADTDDTGCFTGAQSSLVRVSGCLATNSGFDGTSYLTDWPNGNPNMHPTPTLFSSPLTGAAYNVNYSRAAFNTDLPAIEGGIGFCNNNTGSGCSLIPPTDDKGAPAQFYPYYTIGHMGGTCYWSPGQNVPGFTTRNFGGNAQYGHLLKVVYAGLHGTKSAVFNDFNGVLPNNPCPA